LPAHHFSVPDLRTSGPVLDAILLPSKAALTALVAGGQSPPVPLTVPALVDTGASASVIQSGLAQQLSLQPVSAVLVNTPSHAGVLCPLYAVQILLCAGRLAFDVTAIEAPLQGQGIQCLIGRDVLANCVLIYQGWVNSFTIAG